MRKRTINGSTPVRGEQKPSEHWLNIEEIATVEVTSEDHGFPIDSVFNENRGRGWRASEKGEQQIRLIFDQPADLRRIHLRFVEAEIERSQEFTLKWARAGGDQEKEVVRQQWNFSPAGSILELEDYDVHLDGVARLELAIVPDLARGVAHATLAEWRIG